MPTAQHLSFSRNAVTTLLVAILTTGLIGCSSDDAVSNPDIKMTNSYKVEYIPGEMDAAMGKTQFQIAVIDLASNEAVTGETVTLMPMMYMTDKTHSTPVDNNAVCIESAVNGTYNCTVYYVMADVDATGASTGYWELQVMIGGMAGESVMFYPSVGMAMGGTTLAKLKNSKLAIMTIDGPVARTFQVFKSSLTGTTGDHTFELFTATMETMMSFPAIYNGTSLSEGTPLPLVIDSMTVEVSTDSSFPATSATISANSDASGHWTAAGINGLQDGIEGTLYVRVITNTYTLNSSIDGVAGAGINEYATFTVTPPAAMP